MRPITAALALILTILLVLPAQAEEWDARFTIIVNLVGVDFTENAMDVRIEPITGVSYTDGETWFGAGIAWSNIRELGDRYWMPAVYAGHQWASVGVGLRLAEPDEPGAPWGKSVVGFAGPGSPVDSVLK